MVMFGLVMSEDICSKQDRRKEILQGLANLPAMMEKVYRDCFEKDNKIVAASERIRKHKSVIILSRGTLGTRGMGVGQGGPRAPPTFRAAKRSAISTNAKPRFGLVVLDGVLRAPRLTQHT